MGEDGEERPADFDQIVENTGLDPEQVGLTSRLQTMIFSLESNNCTGNKILVMALQNSVWTTRYRDHFRGVHSDASLMP